LRAEALAERPLQGIGERDRTKVRTAASAAFSLLPIDIVGFSGRELPFID
jgi:hypothetical protein